MTPLLAVSAAGWTISIIAIVVVAAIAAHEARQYRSRRGADRTARPDRDP